MSHNNAQTECTVFLLESQMVQLPTTTFYIKKKSLGETRKSDTLVQRTGITLKTSRGRYGVLQTQVVYSGDFFFFFL